MKNKENIIKFANAHDYENAVLEGFYNNSNVYSAIYRNNDELSCIGLPAFILEKGNKLEWVQDERSIDILNYFYPEE